MSSLTYDFKDLSTSHGSSITPRKRLSLSSISSLDSPHPSSSSCFGYSSLGHGHNSPLSSGISSSSSSTDPAMSNSGGVFSDTPTPSAECGKENQPPSASKHPDLRKDSSLALKKVLSVPHLKARRPRLLGVKADRGKKDKGGECNNSVRKARPDVRYPSPVGFTENFSPIGKMHGHLTKKGTKTMMSSPLVDAITQGKSSAFKLVVSSDTSVKTSKRQVLGAIDANIPIPYRSPRTPENSVASIRTKRVWEESVNSTVEAATRKRKCSKSLNAKSAFLQERKTKSADAIMTGRRPVPVFPSHTSFAGRRISYRPISAPILMGNDDDDDYSLSHSSLCSHDSDDEELKSRANGEPFSPSSYREEEIENMLTENMKEYTACDVERSSSDTPSTLDGLISGVLLLKGNASVSGISNDTDDSISALGCVKSERTDDDLKPRELFRSPSAPPLVPSRRALMKLKRSGRNLDRSANDSTPVSIKRPRTFASLSEDSCSPKFVDPGLNRSRSYNELDIMKAVDDGCKDQDLVGDFTRKCALPTVTGRKQDLKYISSNTLVEVLKKEHEVGMVEIVDCRYTYEYEGGHINGAHNIYTEEQLIDRYFNCSRPLWAKAKQNQAQTGDERPHVLVFHCEFSSERAPRLARFLRNYDRSVNVYPSLHYPEIYLLKDGYKEFYRVMKEHCEPCSYIPMSHEGFAGELRKFRIKSKTWAGEKSKQGLLNRLKKR